MLKDGSPYLYLAYSGVVPRDSSEARLLKRAWESLRRNDEFQRDCAFVQAETRPADPEKLKTQFKLKWGMVITDSTLTFNDIVGPGDMVSLDDPDQFDDIYRRLYGDTFYGEDRVVQCDELNRLYALFNAADFERLSVFARSQRVSDTPFGQEGIKKTIARNPPVSQNIQLTIDVDENPIAILFKVQLIIRALREARVQAGKVDPIPPRIKQQLQTLEHALDADLVGDLKRDFRQDDEVFQVWGLCKEGKPDSHIAQRLWPEEYQIVGGRDTATGERGPLIQRVSHYKARANKWIQRFTEVIKDENVIL